MSTTLKLLIASFCIYFFGWLFVYQTKLNETLVQSEDTIPAIFLPVSIIKDHTLYLDNYYQMMVSRYPHPDDKDQALGKTPFYLRKVDNHYLSAFPIVTPLLALPVYLFPVLFGGNLDWFTLAVLSKIAAALIISLSGVVLYKLLLTLLDQKKATLLACLYLFATINFASISQALWQHGALELFTLLGIFYLFKAETNQKFLVFSGLFMGIAVLARPTAGLAFIILGFYVLRSFGFGGLKKYVIPLLFPIAFFFLYNSLFYQSISNQGYSSQLLDSWKTPIYKGFLGIWLSPSKGILVYSPIFIFSVLTIIDRARKRSLGKDSIYNYFAAIVLLHTLVIGMWKHWYGGWSFGYRMASDVIPYLILLLVPYLKSGIFEKTKKLFYLFIVWSVAVEIFGLVFFDGVWHGTYDRGFRNQAWLWSLKDSELVFYVGRIFAKVRLLYGSKI